MANPVNPKPSSRTFASITLSTAADGVSEPVNLTGLTLCCVQLSTAWTAAKIGFQGSVDGVNYYPVRDATGGFWFSLASANRVVAFDPAPFAGLERLKVTSMSSNGVAIAQAEPRTLILGLAKGKLR